MSSLSPSPDQRKTTNLQDKTNSPTKPQERLVEPFNSSLIQSKKFPLFHMRLKISSPTNDGWPKTSKFYKRVFYNGRQAIKRCV